MFTNFESAWQEFIEKQIVHPELMPAIMNSWQRSWLHSNPNQNLKISKLTSELFLATQINSFDFISIARPIMEDAYQSTERSETMFLLVNRAGYVLEMLGDNEMLKELHGLGIQQGALVSEEHIGTNALGLALFELMPVQVVGAQHFRQEFHNLASAAAPIFDLTGRPLGALGLFTYVENYHPHSLGMVVTGARAIEGQRQADTLLAEQNSQLAQLNAILSSITDGILVWNSDLTLIHVNVAAGNILGRSHQSMEGKQIDQLLSVSPALLGAIRENEPIRDVEVNVILDDRNISCIVSTHFIFNKRNNLMWGIITLRAEKDVRKLVQRQVGANAALTLDDIPGDSVQIQRVRNFVHSAANAEASILIRGEAGTGKNVLANAIHNAGSRHDGPFVIFSCTSIPNELVISELLGHEENTTPGRIGSRPSKFELAKGGTLYFQDVDVLPLEAQSVLLNALELGIVQRIGSHRPIDVDVRVIASTAARMETLLPQGSFRSDLYYRLSTFAITIPPLRDRTRDIPLVVDRILRRLSNQLGYSLQLGQGVIEILRRYPWPGNVREIEAVLGRAAIQVENTGVIESEHLPQSLLSINQILPGGQTTVAIRSLGEVDREAIITAAQLCRGNVSQMAGALGIGRTTLWRRLKELDIQASDYRQKQNSS
ncbi:MAG TPA: sigma 54-interacting transcriptional regulator [Anaerolineales bacterium]|jgi:transcriptional activator for dhaKLM operon